MRKILFFILILLSVFQVNAQKVQYLKSPEIPGTDTVWVFTPAKYPEKDKIYPAVYLLHGWSGSYKQWNGVIDLQKMADNYGFILICPDGFYDSWYLNSPIKKDAQFQTFFFQSLMPEMNRVFKTDTSKIFITGLSMGGQGALSLFTAHPEKFLSAGSTSGALDLENSKLQKLGLKPLLGDFETNKNLYAKMSVINNLSTLANSGKSIIIDCGTEDFLYETNLSVVAKLRDLKAKTTYISRPGKHDYPYWKKSIVFQLDFFKNQIQ